MNRRVAVVLALGATALAGCGGGAPPEVVFAAGGASATARPTQYCEDDFVTCTNDATAPVELAVPLRLAWMLRYVEGCELTEVADQCGCSLATVKRRITRADDELRQQLHAGLAGEARRT